MKLYFTDSKGQRKLVDEKDTFEELVGALVTHRQKMFCYPSNTIMLPGKMDPGSSYVVYEDKKHGMRYTVEN